jgi:hypothetical protein
MPHCAKSTVTKKRECGVSLERLEITPFAVIVGEILQQRRTGSLTIVLARLRKTLYWSQGELTLITSADDADSLAEFLIRRGVLSPGRVLSLATNDPTLAVSAFHESGLFDMSKRQTLLREWLTFQFVPLFSLEEGTAAFSDDEAIEPERRVFLQSTAGAVLDGIRAITNGLVLRRSLGDLRRLIAPDPDQHAMLDMIPFTDGERRFADALSAPQTIETFLKQFTSDSLTAARVVISMMTLGVFTVVEDIPEQDTRSLDDANTTWSCCSPSARMMSAPCGPWRSRGNSHRWITIRYWTSLGRQFADKSPPQQKKKNAATIPQRIRLQSNLRSRPSKGASMKPRPCWKIRSGGRRMTNCWPRRQASSPRAAMTYNAAQRSAPSPVRIFLARRS